MYPQDTEYCIKFPEQDVYNNGRFVGRCTAEYVIVSRIERHTALLSGGIDVSNDPRAWDIAESMAYAENANYMF